MSEKNMGIIKVISKTQLGFSANAVDVPDYPCFMRFMENIGLRTVDDPDGWLNSEDGEFSLRNQDHPRIVDVVPPLDDLCLARLRRFVGTIIPHKIEYLGIEAPQGYTLVSEI